MWLGFAGAGQKRTAYKNSSPYIVSVSPSLKTTLYYDPPLYCYFDIIVVIRKNLMLKLTNTYDGKVNQR